MIVAAIHSPATTQLANAWTILRLTLHVLAASVWVGGQIVMAGLVSTLRRLSPDAPRQAARSFARLIWPAYWVLVATGVWNYLAMDHARATLSWNVVFGVKMFCVVLAGAGAFAHAHAATARARGRYAGIGLAGTLAALVLGVAIAG